MVDRTKVPENRILDVVYNSQEKFNRVVCNFSRGKEIWFLKKGRDHTFTFRCDRAVREAIERNWCYRNEHGYLRPTDHGMAAIAGHIG